MDRLSYNEYSAWISFYNIEPFGSMREDYRAGSICAVAANIMSNGEKKEGYLATDFVPTYDSMLEEEVEEAVSSMNTGIGSAFAALRKQAKN